MIHIDLSKGLDLEDVDIYFYFSSLEHIVTTFPSSLPNMRNLTLRTTFEPQKFQMPSLHGNQYKFFHLKHLELLFTFIRDVDAISLVSFLRATPFVENLRVHFGVGAYLYVREEPIIRISGSPHNHLKDVRVTGFEGSKGQLEFLVHLLENAPNMVVITVDTTYVAGQYGPWVNSNKKEDEYVAAVHWTARRHFERKISPSCSLKLL